MSWAYSKKLIKKKTRIGFNVFDDNQKHENN